MASDHNDRPALPAASGAVSTGSMDTQTMTLPGAMASDGLSLPMRSAALHPRQLGALGEAHAAAWLERRGWTVLDRNWRCRYGELDVVAMDPQRHIVFIEVKTRRTVRHGTPQEAVTSAKQTNLRRAAVQWLIDPAHRIPHDGVRFDVISIMMQGDQPQVLHIPGAF